MDYQDYDNYMQDALGYPNMPQNNNNNMYYPTYTEPTMGNTNNYYYEQQPVNNVDTEELNRMYPEIYRLIYPMIAKICNKNANRKMTKETVDEMVDEIYKNIEPEEEMAATITIPKQQLPPLRNGDVRNPNAKEETEAKKETRHRNYLLQDLIRILILRELLRPGRPEPVYRPHVPPQYYRPPMSRSANTPSQPKPRGYTGLY